MRYFLACQLTELSFLFSDFRQERFLRRWVDALSEPRVTHEIRSIWISYWSQVSYSYTLIVTVNNVPNFSLIGTFHVTFSPAMGR